MPHGSDLLFSTGSRDEVGQGLYEDAHWIWPFWSWLYCSLLEDQILDLFCEFAEGNGKSGVFWIVDDFVLFDDVLVYSVNIVGFVHRKMLGRLVCPCDVYVDPNYRHISSKFGLFF